MKHRAYVVFLWVATFIMLLPSMFILPVVYIIKGYSIWEKWSEYLIKQGEAK